jgi:hypothetical protein
LKHSTNPQIIEKVKVLLRFLTSQDADPFVWNKYAIVAVVGMIRMEKKNHGLQ